MPVQVLGRLHIDVSYTADLALVQAIGAEVVVRILSVPIHVQYPGLSRKTVVG